MRNPFNAHLVLGKKGADLAVAIPRFVKGKPDEPAKKVLDAVSFHVLKSTCEQLTHFA